MADAGGSARVGSRRAGSRATQKKSKVKPLGAAAIAAIESNESVGRKFIDDISPGGHGSRYHLGVAEGKGFGDATFSIKVLTVEGQPTEHVSLRHLLRAPGRVHHAEGVTTAVRSGSHVVLDGSPRSGFEIYAVLSPEQGLHAVDLLGLGAKRSSSRRASSAGKNGYYFNRSSERRRASANRKAALAALPRKQKKIWKETRRSSSGGAPNGWLSFF